MGDNTNNIVPFGKYRGKPVEDMMADQNYCEWLMGQPGIREKYPTIINIIVNGGAAPDMPTPEHNRMQERFNDPELCLAAYRVIMGEEAFKAAIELETEYRSIEAQQQLERELQTLRYKHNEQIVKAGDDAVIAVLNEEINHGHFSFKDSIQQDNLRDREHPSNSLWRMPSQLEWYFSGLSIAGWIDSANAFKSELAKAAKQRAEEMARQATAAKNLELKKAREEEQLRRAIKPLNEIIQQVWGDAHTLCATIESDGWDILLERRWIRTLPNIAIELKPIMGEDYPAILRTMKTRRDRETQRATTWDRNKDHWTNETDHKKYANRIYALIVGQFNAGITFEALMVRFEHEGFALRMLE